MLKGKFKMVDHTQADPFAEVEIKTDIIRCYFTDFGSNFIEILRTQNNEIEIRTGAKGLEIHPSSTNAIKVSVRGLKK